MKRIRKVLVTGGAGFIGSPVTRLLRSQGYILAVITRPNSDISRIKDLAGKIKNYKTDLRDASKVHAIVAAFRPDAIIHLAAYFAVEHQPHEAALLVDTNVSATAALLEAARNTGLKLFVNTSSFFVYRQNPRALKERSFAEPFNLYALTKIQGEQLCTFYSQKYHLPCASLRLFSPYGQADDSGRLIPYMIKGILGNKTLTMTHGTQKRDFIHVDDISNAYACLLKNYSRAATHEVFNIGTGTATSIRGLYAALQAITGATRQPVWGARNLRIGELAVAYADISKAKRLLGWKPRVSLADGLTRVVAWYKKERSHGKKH